MSEFYQGIYTAIGILGGLCAFNYWMIGIMEKRLELKLDLMNEDIHGLIEEMKEERRSKDLMYQFVLESQRKK